MSGKILNVGKGTSQGVPYSYTLSSSGANSCLYEWTLGKFTEAHAPYLETQPFAIGRHEWKLRLFPKSFIWVGVVPLTRMTGDVDVVLTVVNQLHPRRNHVSEGRCTSRMDSTQRIDLFQDIGTAMDPKAGFFRNGRYMLRVEMKVASATRGSFVHRSLPLLAQKTSPVKALVITDRRFKALQRRASIHPFGLPQDLDTGDYVVPATMNESSFVAAVCRDLDCSATSMRLWLCERSPSSDESLMRIRRPLKVTRSRSAKTMGDLAERCGQATDGHLTFYLEVSDDQRKLPDVDSDTWILFCKFLDKAGAPLSYAGSIRVKSTCPIVNLEMKARELVQLPSNVQSEMFILKHDLSPTIIKGCGTIAKSGLHNGAVVVLCPRTADRGIESEVLYRWRQHQFYQDVRTMIGPDDRLVSAVYRSTQQQSIRLSGTTEYKISADARVQQSGGQLECRCSPRLEGLQQQERNRDLCAICFERPKTSGFLHADGVAHVCACPRCVEEIMTGNSPRCPMCNQVVVVVIKKIH